MWVTEMTADMQSGRGIVRSSLVTIFGGPVLAALFTLVARAALPSATNLESMASAILPEYGPLALWGLGLLAFAGLIANRFLLIYPNLLGELPIQSLLVLGLLVLALPAFAGILGRVNRVSPRQAELYYDLPLVYVLLLAVILSVILKLYH